MSEKWKMLEALIQSGVPLNELPSGLITALAGRLEDAILSSSKTKLEHLSTQLQESLQHLLLNAPSAASAAALGRSTSDKDSLAAFILGQVSFAEIMASHACERRLDDRVQTATSDSRYKEYVNALRAKDLTCQELAQVTSERVETVSRKLKYLREIGIADFRRDGARVFNFLTPAGISLAAELQPQAEIVQKSEHSRMQSAFRKKLKTKTSAYMVRPNNFASERYVGVQ